MTTPAKYLNLLFIHIVFFYFFYDHAEQTKQIFSLEPVFWIAAIMVTLLDIVGSVYFLTYQEWSLSIFLGLWAVAPLLSVFLAQRVNQNAFNDCVRNSESVRLQILEYKSTHGRLPSIKNNFPFHMCGNRYLSGSILSYEGQQDDFVLSFSDGIVEFFGSSTEAMTARK